jgi:hypothetical protein
VGVLRHCLGGGVDGVVNQHRHVAGVCVKMFGVEVVQKCSNV